MPKKITQNINKDKALLDMPKVSVPHSKWQNRHSNYLTCNIGDIVPVYVDEVLPNERRKVTMGMLSHMTTPIAPIFNSQYTEFRSFFVPYRMAADLLGGYQTRKSPWVKVFGEDPTKTSADVIVPLVQQKLPDVSSNLNSDFQNNMEAFGGLADCLGYESDSTISIEYFNFLDFASYEIIYQYKYRNQNREAATNSSLYKWLFNLYNRTSSSGVPYSDKFHVANREKDYFTGANPFTQKGDPISVNVGTEAEVKLKQTRAAGSDISEASKVGVWTDEDIAQGDDDGTITRIIATENSSLNPSSGYAAKLIADLTTAKGVSIEELRVLIKLQEALEKDALYGSDYASHLNARFGTCPMSLILEEPLELKRVTITSQMQPIFQTSTTSGEPTILGTIGANATTQSGEFEIVPETEFKEYGLLIICACHKAQNSYDAIHYKPKRIFKKDRFSFYTPELNDLGYQPISRLEFDAGDSSVSIKESVGFNEAWAEYRFGRFNEVHGMFEPSRIGSLYYWTLAVSGVSDIQSLYKQGVAELDRSISVESSVAPQFFDAYGFIDTVSKPMSLHSIPGMDGVI